MKERVVFNLTGKSDSEIRRDVKREVFADPTIVSKNIGISCEDGIVLLYGTVDNHREKRAIEHAAQRAGGVKAIADNIDVSSESGPLKTDQDIAHAAVRALGWNFEIPQGIKVVVDHGMIRLEGEADWEYERQAAARALEGISGVKSVINEMTLRTQDRSIL
jgi:osmotically-inducible protein OsmY